MLVCCSPGSGTGPIGFLPAYLNMGLNLGGKALPPVTAPARAGFSAARGGMAFQIVVPFRPLRRSNFSFDPCRQFLCTPGQFSVPFNNQGLALVSKYLYSQPNLIAVLTSPHAWACDERTTLLPPSIYLSFQPFVIQNNCFVFPHVERSPCGTDLLSCLAALDWFPPRRRLLRRRI